MDNINLETSTSHSPLVFTISVCNSGFKNQKGTEKVLEMKGNQNFTS